MPRKPKPPAKAVTTPELNVPRELLDQLVKGPMTQGELESMFRSLKKAVIERAMNAEMSDHLGYHHGEGKPEGQANQRNGTTGKTVITDDGPVRIEVPPRSRWLFRAARFRGIWPRCTVRRFLRSSSARSLMKWQRRLLLGRAVRWNRCIRWYFSMPYA
jgi:hypothetical protein